MASRDYPAGLGWAWTCQEYFEENDLTKDRLTERNIKVNRQSC